MLDTIHLSHLPVAMPVAIIASLSNSTIPSVSPIRSHIDMSMLCKSVQAARITFVTCKRALLCFSRENVLGTALLGLATVGESLTKAIISVSEMEWLFSQLKGQLINVERIISVFDNILDGLERLPSSALNCACNVINTGILALRAGIEIDDTRRRHEMYVWVNTILVRFLCFIQLLF